MNKTERWFIFCEISIIRP